MVGKNEKKPFWPTFDPSSSTSLSLAANLELKSVHTTIGSTSS